MANMSYCRFRNTLNDFRELGEHWEDDDLSRDDHNARRILINDAIDMLSSFGFFIENEEEVKEEFPEIFEKAT